MKIISGIFTDIQDILQNYWSIILKVCVFSDETIFNHMIKYLFLSIVFWNILLFLFQQVILSD